MKEYFITLHYREYGDFDLSYTDDNDDILYHKLPLYERHGRLALTASLGELTDKELGIFVDAAELDRPTLLYKLGNNTYPCAFTIHTAETETPKQKAQRVRSLANFDHLDQSKIGKLFYEHPITVMDNENDDPILEMNRFLGIVENIVKERPKIDETKGKWTPLDEAADFFRVKPETLADYRTRGAKDPEGLSGVDSQGHRWRQSRSNAATEYFIPDGASD